VRGSLGRFIAPTAAFPRALSRFCCKQWCKSSQQLRLRVSEPGASGDNLVICTTWLNLLRRFHNRTHGRAPRRSLCFVEQWKELHPAGLDSVTMCLSVVRCFGHIVEWHLILANAVQEITFRLVSWFSEKRVVLWSAFSESRFVSIGSVGDTMNGDRIKQFFIKATAKH
jgi:hypothetical protein